MDTGGSGGAIAAQRVALLVLVALLRGCDGSLHFLTRSDTVYMRDLPFHNLVELELAVEGDWNLQIAACHEGEQFQEIFNHNGHGPVEAFPFTLQWHKHSNIYMNVTLLDLAAGKGWVQQKRFAVKFLEPVSYVTADPAMGQYLHELDPQDQTVGEHVAWAVEELSSTLRLTWDRVVQALLISRLPVSEQCQRRASGDAEQVEGASEDTSPGRAREQQACVAWAEALSDAAEKQGGHTHMRLYVTLEARVFEPGASSQADASLFVLGMERGLGSAAPGSHALAPSLLHAHTVSPLRWAGLRTMDEMTQEGVCADKEEQIDEDLAPWEATGGVIDEAQVRDMASEAAWSRYCNRVLILNNSLSIVFAHQDQASKMTSDGKKWYTMALLEVLTSLLARVRLPDVDVCVAEEGPQVLRGGYQPMLAATRSHAHMDLLVPDLFFYLWETPPHLVPHPWYKPPFNLASPLVYAGDARPKGRDFQVGLAWEEREGRAFWRGSVDEWAMNARGRLCRLAARRPDIFDVEPIRVVGRALHTWKDFPLEEVDRFEEAIRRGGAGVAVDPAASLKFKYVINIHGNGNEWSNRFRMLLSSGALVLKQESTLFEYWERHLRPFEHYIPVKADLSDLIEKVEWARDNDDAARRIASAAVAFVREHLHLDAVQCYWGRLLDRYSKLQDFQPVLPPNAVAVANVASNLWRVH